MESYNYSKFLSLFKNAFIFLLLFSVTSVVFAVPINTLRVFASDPGDEGISKNLSSTTGPVSYSGFTGSVPSGQVSGFGNYATVNGYADFGVVKGKTTASTSGYGTSRQASTNARSRYQVFVLVDPDLGLTLGQGVSIKLDFRLDGFLDSSAWGVDSVGHGDFGAKLSIQDKDIKLDCGSPDGCYTPKLMEFSAGGASTTYSSNGYNYNDWSWQLKTRNDLGDITSSESDSRSWDLGPGSSCLPSESNFYCAYDVIFNTGVLSAVFDTTVGAILDIDLSLNTFSNSVSFDNDPPNTGARGFVDFIDTFGLAFNPVTEGVVLGYGDIEPAFFDPGGTTGGTGEVPEPATLAMMALGLAGLGFSQRRKRR